jgi:hypothetical protein
MRVYTKLLMLPQHNIHKFTSLHLLMDRLNDQIDHSLIDRRWHSNVLDIRPSRVADCDSDHYLVVSKLRERMAVSKQRFNLKELNEVEGKGSIVLKSQIGSQRWETYLC